MAIDNLKKSQQSPNKTFNAEPFTPHDISTNDVQKLTDRSLNKNASDSMKILSGGDSSLPVEREHEIKKQSFISSTTQFNSRNGQTIFAFPSSTPQLMGPFSFSRADSPGLVSN